MTYDLTNITNATGFYGSVTSINSAMNYWVGYAIILFIAVVILLIFMPYYNFQQVFLFDMFIVNLIIIGFVKIGLVPFNSLIFSISGLVIAIFIVILSGVKD